MPVSYGIADYKSQQLDFSGGLVGGISDMGLAGRIKHLRLSDNFIFRPGRAMRARPGCQDVMPVTLTEPPLSIGKYYNASGNKAFVHTDAGGGVGSLWRIDAAGPVKQTLPFAITDKRMSFVMVNGVLVATQEGGSNPPIFFAQSNPSETWHSMILTKPLAATTFGADQVGGSLTVTKDYFYRVRWRYLNGSSKTSPVSAAQQVVAASGNYTIQVTNLTPTAQGVTARSDYIGWTLERSKADGTVLGPFYTVMDGTASSYDDGSADADLFDRTSEVIHDEPLHFEGLIAHKSCLFGWVTSSLLYRSQVIGDDEATGICNWDHAASYLIGKDDGDSIQGALIQSDRIVLGKRLSVHVFEGDDADSFRPRILYESAGFAGPRAACASGRTCYFDSGEGGFFRMSGDDVRPFGWAEISHYLDLRDLDYTSNAVVKNYLGDFILFAYTAEPDLVNSDVLAYDLRFGNWCHIRGWRIVDALVQKDEADFNRATLLFCDPSPVVPAGAEALALNPSFVSWRDNRSATQVFVQSMSSVGAQRWAANGVAASLSSGTSQTLNSGVCGDGSGGMIVGFGDNRGGARVDLYIQLYNAAGTAQWGAGGTAIKATAGHTSISSIVCCSDGTGGAFIVWVDNRTANTRVYVQRVTAAGAIVAAAGGVQCCNTGTADLNPSVIPDGAGGCFVVWSLDSGTVRVQRFNSSVVAQYTTASEATQGRIVESGGNSFVAACASGDGGIVIGWAFNASTYVKCRKLASDGTFPYASLVLNSGDTGNITGLAGAGDQSGGAFFSWGVAGATLRCQRVTSSGVAISTTSVVVCTTTSALATIAMVQSGTDSAIVSWAESTSGDIFAQKMDPTLFLIWSGGSKLSIVAVSGAQTNPALATDGDGGCILTWSDDRSGTRDIYAQRVLSDGSFAWATDGVLVCSATGDQNLSALAFTDAPTGQIPTQGAAGYHVWSGFKGTTDYASISGSNGQAISLLFETALIDDGAPDYFKDFKRLEIYAETDTVAITATMVFAEDAPAAQLSLVGVNTGVAVWDDDIAAWDDGVSVWGGDSRLTAQSGIPHGALARRYALRVTAEAISDLIISGFSVDAQRLPERRWS